MDQLRERSGRAEDPALLEVTGEVRPKSTGALVIDKSHHPNFVIPTYGYAQRAAGVLGAELQNIPDCVSVAQTPKK